MGTGPTNDAASAPYMSYCKQRASRGFNSGMGMIFRKVAEITSMTTAVSMAQSASTTVCENVLQMNTACGAATSCSDACRKAFLPWRKDCDNFIAKMPLSMQGKIIGLERMCTLKPSANAGDGVHK